MGRCLVVALFIAAAPVIAQSDVSEVHQSTTTPPDARYEVVQSELAARWTFKLDRYTGKVWQLVQTEKSGNTWREMSVESFPAIANPGRPRFQIFTSGLAARFTFLIDTMSGKTWTLTMTTITREDGSKVELHYWSPFPE